VRITLRFQHRRHSGRWRTRRETRPTWGAGASVDRPATPNHQRTWPPTPESPRAISPSSSPWRPPPGRGCPPMRPFTRASPRSAGRCGGPVRRPRSVSASPPAAVSWLGSSSSRPVRPRSCPNPRAAESRGCPVEGGLVGDRSRRDGPRRGVSDGANAAPGLSAGPAPLPARGGRQGLGGRAGLSKRGRMIAAGTVQQRAQRGCGVSEDPGGRRRDQHVGRLERLRGRVQRAAAPGPRAVAVAPAGIAYGRCRV
jgi:hypothetical protein